MSRPLVQGAEAVLREAAAHMGPALLESLPALRQQLSGALLPEGVPPDQLATAPPTADPQVRVVLPRNSNPAHKPALRLIIT